MEILVGEGPEPCVKNCMGSVYLFEGFGERFK